MVTVNGPEGYTPLPATATTEVKMAAPVQLRLAGPKRVKVIVPVGATPPERVAVSLMAPPAGTVGEAVVTMAGVALVMTTASAGSLHNVVTAALLASPL